MSLHLDARQRAMLQEMGVTIWAPAQVSAAPAPVNDAARSQRTAAEAPTPAPAAPKAGAGVGGPAALLWRRAASLTVAGAADTGAGAQLATPTACGIGRLGGTG